jgi:hypothetical protein
LFSLANTGAIPTFEQARRDYPELDDRGVVRVLCSRLLREADLEPPIDASVLASMCGIARIEHRDQPWAGLLMPGKGGHLVTLRAGDGFRRQRFTLMHEAAHTLLPDLAREPEYRCEPQKRRPPKERLADTGAAELLMPRRYFEGDLEWFGMTMRGICALADRYRTSLEATALRAVELSSREALCVVFEEDPNSSSPGLRTAYAVRKGRWPCVPKGQVLPPEGLFARALSERLVEGEIGLSELVPESEARVFASVISCPLIQKGEVERRVIALVTVSEGKEAQGA